MWLLAGLAERNILAQLAPPGVYVWQLALLTAFYLRHCHSALCGFQRLDRTVDQGRRASGVSVHGPAAAMAAAYPLRRQTDTVIARASLAPGWLHGRGHLAFLLATPFDAARLYGDFGMHAPRLFTLSMLARAAVDWCGTHILHNITIPVYLRPLAPQARPVVEARLYQLPSWQELLQPCDFTNLYTEKWGLRVASRGRAASRGEGERTENREHIHRSVDLDQAVRTSYDLLAQDGLYARSRYWAMPQSICMRTIPSIWNQPLGDIFARSMRP